MKWIVFFLVLALSGPCAFAANTVTESYGRVVIVPDGTTDWAWTSLTNAAILSAVANDSGLRLHSIQFNPSAVGDVLVIRDGSLAGTKLFNSGTVTSTVPMIKYFPERPNRIDGYKLFLEGDDCTISGTGEITIEYEPW